jgi:hypothetical protein
MQDIKETLRLTALGSVSPEQVSALSRIACVSNLQQIRSRLRSAWTFLMVLNSGNESDTSFLVVRVQVCIEIKLFNLLHFRAVPMCDCHIGENRFNLMCTTLDNLAPNWRKSNVSVTTDGTSSIIGYCQGMASRLERVALPGFCLVGALFTLQLNLLLQQLYSSPCDDSFVWTLTSMTGHLCPQFNLIAQMGSKCPRFVETQ